MRGNSTEKRKTREIGEDFEIFGYFKQKDFEIFGYLGEKDFEGWGNVVTFVYQNHNYGTG
jgi:hypothetical protein